MSNEKSGLSQLTALDWIMMIAAVLIVLGWLFGPLLIGQAKARDDGRYKNVDPQIKQWIEGLKDKEGIGCCSTADGFPPEAVWDVGKDQYRVMIQGQWYDVPESAIIQAPNLIGKAMVWYFTNEQGKIQIRCFIAGTLT